MLRWRHITTGLLMPGVVYLSSCSKVNFSVDSNKVGSEGAAGGGGGGGGGSGTISCSPLLNGSSTTLTMQPSTANPTLDANCTPSSVVYTWSVDRGGTPVTINGLTGSSSTPDFRSAGAGTYNITLDASATDWTSFHLGTPLQVVVESSGGSAGTISCDPKINGSQTSFTLAGTNPTITANCTPSSVSYVWTAQRNGSAVTLPGLSGSSSTPDFLTAGPGTYQIWLSATQTSYNSYTSPSPLTVTVPAASTGTPVTQSATITTSNNKLDILLVIDDSSSMLADNQRLASRLEGFVNSLSTEGFDWQMCVTVTNAQRISSSDPNYYWGASIYWNGNSNSPGYILKSGTSNINSIFTNTINSIGAGWAGTNDERAIKAAWWHLWNGEPGVDGTSGCYRQDAGLAVVILSDEDERSVGGDQTQVYYPEEANLPLENDDKPQTYVDYVRQVFGSSKRFTVNSIVVRPGDSACMSQQDAEGSKSHYGVQYNQLSGLTGGYVGSICDSDFSTNLKYFKENITRSQASITLQCTPTGSVTDTVSPSYTHTTALDGNKLVFTPQIPAGSTVQLQYTCP